MKNNFRLKEHFAKLSKKTRALQDPQLMHPQREWVVGLLGALALFLFAISLGAYTYFKNQSVEVHIEGEDIQTVYRASLVEKVLATMNERENNLRKLSEQGPGIEPEVATSSDIEISLELSPTTAE